METTEDDGIAEKIRLAIAKSGKSDQEIAKRSGLSVAAIYAYRKSTRHPSASSLSKLAKGLGIPVTDLI